MLNELNSENFYLEFHLQWFAAEDEGRTEQPTGRKKSKARTEGQVARSSELPQAVILLFSFLALSVFGGYQLSQIQNFMQEVFSGGYAKIPIDHNFVKIMSVNIFLLILKIAGPVLFIAMIVGYIADVAQVGFMFNFGLLKFDISKIRLNPASFFQKILISKNSAYNFLKSIVKFIIIGYVTVSVLTENYEKFINLIRLELPESLKFIWDVAYEIGIKTAIYLIIFSAFDYWWNHKQYIENLKMTKHELKDEFKQSEGDPLIKSKIREKQRMIAQRRMMKEVPKADVVITNPTHLAVAIKYDSAIMAAPIVVAKGEGFIALKIREIAEAAGVPIYEDKPLARALYEAVEIGEQIPVQLYKAVAEVLAFVYKLKNKKVFS